MSPAAPNASAPSGVGLRGLITEADLPAAEAEWPGLQAFLGALPANDRPATFLDLVWRFETEMAAAA